MFSNILSVDGATIYYGKTVALKQVYLDIPKQAVTAFIGPSGCGKSTLLRCFNRLNDLVPSFKLQGRINYYGQDLYAKDIDPVSVRRQIGMVFQKANPFPKSIYENIAFGLRVNGIKDNIDDRVEKALRGAALWDEVKDRLRHSGLALSGGQQQRLCIARAIALEPKVLLMDEPCSALDPIATLKVEELIHELKKDYTIVIVTHNMQQASRVSDYTAFFNVRLADDGHRQGYLVEYKDTKTLFYSPEQEETAKYLSGAFG